MKAKLRHGAIVWMDHRVWTWPDIPHGDPDIVFEVRQPTHNEDRKELRADFFGAPRPKYGSGALYVYTKDLIPIDEPT